MRTFKLPVGRPLPVGRAHTAAGPPSGARLRVASLAAVAAVLAASACAASACGASSAATSPPSADTAATGAPAAVPAAAARASAAGSGAKAAAPVSAASASPGSVGTGSASCPTAAWAYKVASDGAVLWKVSLPLASSDGVTDGLSPVLSGNYAVFAEGHSVVALRLSDGHRLWRRVFPQAKDSFTGQISFLYGFHSTVIALVGQVSADSRLVALNLKTGAVRWTLPLGSHAVIGAPVVTVDSVFAFLTPRGRLEAASLWTGKRLWSRAYGLATGQPALAALGSLVIAASSSSSAAVTTTSVTSFVGQTGKALWTRTGMPQQPTLLATPGALYVYDVDQNVYPLPKLFPVTELNPANGKPVWRIPTAAPVSAVWVAPDVIVIATTGRAPRLIVGDPPTRHVRWSAATPADAGTVPLLNAVEMTYVKSTSSTATLVTRDALSGPVRWSVPIPPAQPRYLVATGGGTTLLSFGQATVPGKAGALVIGNTGKVVARISLPAPAQAPPAVSDGNQVVLQLDTLVCATAAVGSAAVGSAVGHTAALTASTPG